MNMIDQNKENSSIEKNEIITKSTTITASSSFAQLSLDDDKCLSDKDPSNDQKIYSFVLFDALTDICKNNVKYFECDESEAGQRFLGAFQGIIDHVVVAKQFIWKVVRFAHEYDFDEHTPANGYRSFVKATQSCINHSLKVSKYIAQNRSYLLFRRTMYMKCVFIY